MQTNNVLPATYILIDCENVNININDNEDLSLLNNIQNYHLYLFLGKNHNKLSTDLVLHMHNLKEKACYIKIEQSAKNALDFHIAYYLGKLININPQAKFYIISKDQDYEVLIKTLKQQNLNITIIDSIKKILAIKEINKIEPNIKLNFEEYYNKFVERLSKINKPRQLSGLKNTINSGYGGKLQEIEINNILKKLNQDGYIKIDTKEKVEYFKINKIKKQI